MLFRLFRRTRDREGVSVAAQYEQQLVNIQKHHKKVACIAVIRLMEQLNVSFTEVNNMYVDIVNSQMKEKTK